MISVKPVIPKETILTPLTSDSVHILDCQHHEVLPESQVSYSYSGSNEIVFNINSASHFLDLLDTYFRFDITATLTDGGTAITTRVLNQGGVGACFRDIEVRTPSGVVIERLDRQNILANILSNMSEDLDHVEMTKGHAGDSSLTSTTEVYGPPIRVPISDVYIDVAGGAGDGHDVLNGSDAAFTPSTYLVVGDIVELRGQTAATADVVYARGRITNVVAGAVADDAVLLSLDQAQVADLGAANAGNGYRLYKVSYEPVRKVAAQTASYRVTWTPKHMGIFKLREYLPLFLMKGGIQIVFRLEQPGLALSTAGHVLAGAYVSNIVLDNVRCFAKFIKPSQQLFEMYKELYNSKEGLSYVYQTYRHVFNTQNGGAGTYSEPLHINARSVRHILSVIRPLAFESDNSTLAEMDKISDFHRAKVDRFQLVSGSETWPRRELRAESDTNAWEFWQHYIMSMNKYGSTIFTSRIQPWEWSQTNILPSVDAAEAKKFCMATRLDRSDAPFSGYDASINPINLELNFSGVFNDSASAQQTRAISSFAQYDVLLSLSASSGTRVMN